MQIVNEQIKYPPAPLIEPNRKGYIHLAFECDYSPLPFYPFMSSAKKEMIRAAKEFAESLRSRKQVDRADVFRAVVRPPAKQPFLEVVRDRVHLARFDVAILIETDGVQSARDLRDSDAFQQFLAQTAQLSRARHVVVAENARRIDEVDKTRPGVFLFNYFFAEDVNELLPVWEYTAGWFIKETDLDNSTLFMPIAGEKSNYSVINHCRWDSLPRLMPRLMFFRTIRTYVMANFAANKILAMPILYRLA